MRLPPRGGFLVPPGSGQLNRLRMLVTVTEQQSRGAFFVFERALPPGAAVALHEHTRDTGLAYVITGELHYLVGSDWFVAGAGAYVVKPAGVPHACRNDASVPAQVIEIATPGHAGAYYAELDALVHVAGTESRDYRAALDALSERYGVHWSCDDGELA